MAGTVVTIQYLPGCPNLELARTRVSQAVARLATAAPEVRVQEIHDEAEAERTGFHGSPTVLVDGVDPFTGADCPVSFSCRMYPHDGGADGAPSIEELMVAMAGAEGPASPPG